MRGNEVLRWRYDDAYAMTFFFDERKSSMAALSSASVGCPPPDIWSRSSTTAAMRLSSFAAFSASMRSQSNVCGSLCPCTRATA